MRLSPLSLSCALAALLPLGCGSEPSNNPDSGVQPVTDLGPPEDVPAVEDRGVTPPRDVPVDRGPPRDAGALYQPCMANSDCPGGNSIAQCLTEMTGSPRGFCTRSCTFEGQCGAGHICAPVSTGSANRRCYQTCQSARDCRGGYACFTLTVGTDMARICGGFCSEDSHCASGSCDLYSRRCGVTTMGADNGSPCTANANCRGGFCRAEATGWTQGYCFSRALLAPEAEYMGERLPRATCPTGSVCIGETSTLRTLGLCLCFRECTQSTDCRAGYQCLHPERPGGGTYTNGYCAPANCRAAGMTCPAGYTCRDIPVDGGPPNGFCAPINCRAAGMTCPAGFTCRDVTTDGGMPNGVCVGPADAGTPADAPAPTDSGTPDAGAAMDVPRG